MMVFLCLDTKKKTFWIKRLKKNFKRKWGSRFVFKCGGDPAKRKRLFKKPAKKNLPKNKHIVPIDLGIEINPLESGLKTDLVFTIHRERKNNKNEVLLRLQNNALEKLA